MEYNFDVDTGSEKDEKPKELSDERKAELSKMVDDVLHEPKNQDIMLQLARAKAEKEVQAEKDLVRNPKALVKAWSEPTRKDWGNVPKKWHKQPKK
jgi:hypothetical protein